MANPHSSAGRLSYGAALADAALIIVAVHGRGQTPAYLVEHLIEPLHDHDIGLDDIAWVLHAADENRWYPLGFMAPLADNEPLLGYALAALADIELELTRPLVWAGFSQGACLVAEHVARQERPHPPAGLICLTGGMIGPAETELHVVGSVAGMPAYFFNSAADEWVPLSRTEATVEAFRAAGAEVELELFKGREHVISAGEVASVARFLRRIAG